MAKKHEIVLMDKGFLEGVVDTLKSIDVRGYESNKRLVIITMELERTMNTNLPFEIEPNEKSAEGSTQRKATQAADEKK